MRSPLHVTPPSAPTPIPSQQPTLSASATVTTSDPGSSQSAHMGQTVYEITQDELDKMLQENSSVSAL